MDGGDPQATPSDTASSAERSEDGAVHLTETAIRVTTTLKEFKTSDPPSKLTEFLNSSQLNEHTALWKAGFPSALLTIILDEDWYEPFLTDSLVSGSGTLALSEQSVSVLVSTPSLQYPTPSHTPNHDAGWTSITQNDCFTGTTPRRHPPSRLSCSICE